MPAKFNRHGGDYPGTGVKLDGTNTDANTLAAANNMPQGPWGMIIPLGEAMSTVTIVSDRIAGTLTGWDIVTNTPVDASNIVRTAGEVYVCYAVDPKVAAS